MAGIEPIPGAGGAPSVRRVEGRESCGPCASPGAAPFGGLLEDALRRLESLDEKLRPAADSQGGKPSVERLQSDLREADRAMRSAEEIREMLLRAYQTRSR